MRVLIYSTNRLFGECLKHGLSLNKEVTWVGFAADIPEAVSLAKKKPGITLLLDMACGEMPEVLETLQANINFSCSIALAVDVCNGGKLLRCASLGFQGFVPTDTPLNEVTEIILAANRGEVHLQPKATAGLLRELREKTVEKDDSFESLTLRERDICRLVCDGLTNKEIALEINRSVGTVKNHIHAILTKLNVARRAAIPRCCLSKRL